MSKIEDVARCSAMLENFGRLGNEPLFGSQKEDGIQITLQRDARWDQASDVRRMVTRQAAAVSGVGIAIGVVAALVVMRALSALLFEVRPIDPVSLTAAAAVLAAVSAAASWLPARRAASTDPAQALRAD